MALRNPADSGMPSQSSLCVSQEEVAAKYLRGAEITEDRHMRRYPTDILVTYHKVKETMEPLRLGSIGLTPYSVQILAVLAELLRLSTRRADWRRRSGSAVSP
jgi:hypothetical protein